jgi:hypothetical protein
VSLEWQLAQELLVLQCLAQWKQALWALALAWTQQACLDTFLCLTDQQVL